MNTLVIINSYIKYVYYLLALIILITLIVLIVTIKPLVKTINEITTTTGDIKQGINDINEKVAKIKYTIDNSLPLFGFLFFILIVIVSAIKDYRNTKLTRRSIVKSTVKQYGIMNTKFKPNRTKKYRKVFISELKRLV
ncbi:MAG: hypothetical protein Q4F12_03735 [Erysipelotrichaceae bacterium]|nr:hypothetical protein [Erysipelotrichaceae bacterium]